jgi:hypothetical protein
LDRLFLDANVLFSAAYRVDSILRWLWTLDDVVLLSSDFALGEVRRNLPAQHDAALTDLLNEVEIPSLLETTAPSFLDAIDLLPAKDAKILRDAHDTQAMHLLTGDRKHFGNYFGQTIGNMLILLPADYLRARGMLD